MVKKIAFIILLLLTVQYSQSDFTFAENNRSITDCFEQGVDCTDDQDDEEDKQNLNNSELLGDKDKSEPKPSFFSTFVQTIVALLLVLVLIYILLRFLNRRNKTYQQVTALENLGGISVGQNKSIQMIRIGEQIYLIGVGDNVEMLQEITDEDMVAELLTKESVPSPVESIFQTVLLRMRKNKTKSEDNNQSDNQFTKVFQNELRTIQKNREDILNKHTDKGDNDG